MLRLSFFLFIAISMLASCGSRQTAATLDDVETYIQTRPDSALAAIRAIDTTTLTTRSLRAHYALLHAMALDKNWIDTTDVNVVMPAVEYYGRHGSDEQKAKAYYYLGRIQQNAGNLPEASISLLKAEKKVESLDDMDFKSMVFITLSTIYSQSHLHEEALRYTELSYKLDVLREDEQDMYSSLFRMAQELNNVGRYSESDSLYRLLMNEEHVHPNHRPSLMCNYALTLVTRHEDYEQAVNVFEEVLSSNGSLTGLNYWGAYAYALIRTGQVKRAEPLFRKMGSLKKNSSKFIYYCWKSKADAYSGDYLAAYQLQKEASDIQDETVEKVLEQSTLKAQNEYLEEMNQESERQARHRQIIAWSSSELLVVIIVVLLFQFHRKKERDEIEKDKLLEAYKTLTTQHSALTSLYSDLNTQLDLLEREKSSVRNKYIQMCQFHFNHLGRFNEMLDNHSNEYDGKLYKALKKALYDIGMDSKNQCEFEKILDESFDCIMTRFREAFPGRKSRFYQLASYLFAGFDTTTICTVIPNINKDNVHVEKHRLKRRIQESDSKYKEQFLRMLS